MPIVKCTTKDGKSGWKYGEKNTSCFADKQKAIEQMYAILISKYGKLGENFSKVEFLEKTVETLDMLIELFSD